jgi:hypothetical protein
VTEILISKQELPYRCQDFVLEVLKDFWHHPIIPAPAATSPLPDAAPSLRAVFMGQQIKKSDKLEL